ncbi:MAG TPA: metal-dependent transcriptional regulator [Anaeromyxobacteraceae bacterium]|nr:metal-dependent transcriptional regulator [Anaeromyxobacteraceae bacterium]
MNPLHPRQIEEILETIFTEREHGRDDAGAVVAHAAPHAGAPSPEQLRELEKGGLVKLAGDRLELTPEGERMARDLVRRHRLTERLFRDVLQLSETDTESQACELEHILSPEATDSVCTLLGHPPTCPHGKAIPPGPCCSALAQSARPIVTGLASSELGSLARIVFIAPRFHDRMDRLAALGVIPGSEIRLHQRSPSFVIEVGETTIALDPEIAREIYVKRIEA